MCLREKKSVMIADKQVLMHWSLVAAAKAAAAAAVAGAEQLRPRVFVVLHLGGLLQSNLLVEMLSNFFLRH